MTDTFSYDDCGLLNGIEVEEVAFTVAHQYGKGYDASRALSTRMIKRFNLIWTCATGANWLAFVEFWRAQHGNANAWYWEFPVGLYGSPGYGGYGGLEPADGFDAAYDTGYGGGPSFLVKFEEAKLPQKYRSDTPGRWQYAAWIREV